MRLSSEWNRNEHTTGQSALLITTITSTGAGNQSSGPLTHANDAIDNEIIMGTVLKVIVFRAMTQHSKPLDSRCPKTSTAVVGPVGRTARASSVDPYNVLRPADEGQA
ncbi:hypothetical protein EVAR_88717_1 [Eumeta japonica]|uniref:Uncharacterized protein n=1 Tax=Eumeta variegata TaxID=151549 RepID=A0A4C1XH60_EUMVA|nr:hypothetical protein EVAR_88717_1 [Eumeta japonica]